MKKIFLGLFLFLFSLSLFPKSVFGVAYCCGKSTAAPAFSDPKLCNQILGIDSCGEYQYPAGTSMPLKSCDQSKDTTDSVIGNYNPDCFVNIKVPSTVKITDFGRLFSGAVAFLLLIAFLLSFFYLILGGIGWLTSGGDKAGVEAARNKIIAAIIGLIIVAATWALFQLIGGAVGFNILRGFEVPRLF